MHADRLQSGYDVSQQVSKASAALSADRLLALSEATDAMLRNILHQEYREALASIAHHVYRLLHAESCAIFLVSSKNPVELRLVAAYSDSRGPDFDDPGPLIVTNKPKGGLTGFVASQGKILRLHGARLKTHPNVSGKPATYLSSEECYSFLGIPVRGADGTTCGVVKVDNKKEYMGKATPATEFNDDDVSIATILANKLSHILDSLNILTELRRSEFLYQSLVQNLPQMISRKDIFGRIIFANQAFCDFIGIQKEALLGKTDYDLYPKDLADAYRQDDNYVIQTRRPIHREEKHKPRPDEPELIVEVTKVPILGPNDEVIETQCIFWNITDRKQRESHLSALMETTNDNIYFKDLKSRFLLISKAQATRFKLNDPQEAIGKTDFDFFNKSHAQQAYDDEQEIMRTGQPMSKQELETWPDGSQTWVSTTKQCLRDKDGKLTGTFGISRDITDQKHAHDRLDLVARQREVLLALRSKLQSLSSSNQAYRLILTLLTSGIGFQFNRALLFLANLEGNYVGVCGIAPRNAKHFEEIGKEVNQWTLEQFVNNFESEPEQFEWLHVLLTQVTLSLEEGYPMQKAFIARGAYIEFSDILPDPALVPVQNDLGITAPYTVIPLIVGEYCLGLLYLDNAFSGKPLGDCGALSELGERLASVINLQINNTYRDRCSEALEQLIVQTEPLIASQEVDLLPLYQCLLHTAESLGARRSCILRRQDQEQWEIVGVLNWLADDSGWRPWFDGLGSQLTAIPGKVLLHPNVSLTTGTASFLTVALPFSSSSSTYAFCLELYPRLMHQAGVIDAASRLAAFSSAILAATERSHFLATDAKSFASGLMRMTAHEARNALNSVLWGLEDYDATRGRATSKEIRQFEILKGHVDAGIEALNAYLELITATEGEKASEISWTPLGSVALQVTNMIKPRIAKYGKDPNSVFTYGSLDFGVYMNRTNLTIVLYNLVSNAVKAIADASDPHIEIGAKFDSDRGLIEIKVIDNGCGITADQRKLLFTPGFSAFAQRESQREPDPKKRPRSSGVGLYNLKTIVEHQHGGKLRLNSLSGRTEALLVLKGRTST